MKRGFIRAAVLVGVCAWMAGVSVADAKGYVGIKASLPFVLYDDCDSETERNFIPAGWMQDASAIDRDECWRKKPHSGSSCIRIKYVASGDWCGIAWQDPPNDWGTDPGGFDLTGAKKLKFWARGQNGGEVVKFNYGIIGKGKEYPDSSHGKEKKVKLTTEWKEYTISVSGNKKCIKTGFVWTVEAGAEDVTFFLDDIRYE